MTLRIPDWELEVECEVEKPWSSTDGDWQATARMAARGAQNVAPELDNTRFNVSVLLTSDDEVRQLNREWRKIDKPTNVLSFPMLTREEVLALAREGPPVMLGDLALAYETCAREAREKGRSLWEHTVHLLVHGYLHLAGYDHELGPAAAEAMEALEVKALAILGIADPYGDHDHSQGK